MAPTPNAVVAALKDYKINYVLVDGWNDPQYQKNANMGYWDPQYVINHHTAGSSDNSKPAASLDWMLAGNKGNNNGNVRACHFLIGRDGVVHVCYTLGTWHAGAGGPYGNISQDMMNTYAYGIEVESAGLVKDFTEPQLLSLAQLDAALCDLLKVPLTHAINHRTWTDVNPRTRGRKVDTVYPDAFLQTNATAAKAAHDKPVPVPIPPMEDNDMLLISRVGNGAVYLLAGNQLTLITTRSDADTLIAAGIKAVSLSEETFNRISAGKD